MTTVTPIIISVHSRLSCFDIGPIAGNVYTALIPEHECEMRQWQFEDRKEPSEMNFNPLRRTTMRKWVSAFFLIVAATAAAAAQDLSSFQAAAERMATALKSGDVETISQMYAEDARILPPGRDIIQGREAIKAFWTEDIKGMSDMALTTVDVKGLGDSDVREIGQFSGKTTGDNPQDFTGKYITIWHKAGDSWQITDDIWNLNK